MSDAGSTPYVPDHLYERLFRPWRLPRAEWPLCGEDWDRVNAITGLAWRGVLLDFGSGDGTLAAMVCSRHPSVTGILGVEQDAHQRQLARQRWWERGWPVVVAGSQVERPSMYDGALVCEVLEHMTPEEGQMTLKRIHGAMKHGAMLCVTVPHESGPRASYPGHVRTFNASSLKAEVEAAGFTVDDGDTIAGKVIPVWIMVIAHA